MCIRDSRQRLRRAASRAAHAVRGAGVAPHHGLVGRGLVQLIGHDGRGIAGGGALHVAGGECRTGPGADAQAHRIGRGVGAGHVDRGGVVQRGIEHTVAAEIEIIRADRAIRGDGQRHGHVGRGLGTRGAGPCPGHCQRQSQRRRAQGQAFHESPPRNTAALSDLHEESSYD